VGLRELAAREYPHLLHQLDLGPLGDAEEELLAALVVRERCRRSWSVAS